MVKQKNALKGSLRQRRTGSLVQSYTAQVKQFLVNCTQRNLTQNTIDSYKNHLSKFEKYLLSVGHSTLIMEVEKDIIEEYILTIKEVEKLSPHTVNSAIRHLKAFFSYLHENDTIPNNPMAKIKKLRVDEPSLKPFTNSQINILLNLPDKSTFVGYRDFIAISLLLGTGMRISELNNLRFADIDIEEGSILIRQAKARKPRIVGIPKSLKPELKRFLNLCFDETPDKDFLFQNLDGGQLGKRTLQERISTYGKTAGITSVKCSPHTFRRTFAINYLKNGGSTASLRQQLGHTTLQVVEKYLYWSDKDVLVEHEKYNAFDNMYK